MTLIRMLAILSLILATCGTSFAADFGRGRLIDLAANRDVRSEIGVTDQQDKRLDEVIEQLRRTDAGHQQARSGIAKVLEPGQLERLEQIRLQALDGLALEDPAVAGKIVLTADQQRRLDDALKANATEEREMEDVMKRVRFPTAKARREFKEKYRKKASDRLLGVLSDAQKAKLEALKGRAYPKVDGLP